MYDTLRTEPSLFKQIIFADVAEHLAKNHVGPDRDSTWSLLGDAVLYSWITTLQMAALVGIALIYKGDSRTVTSLQRDLKSARGKGKQQNKLIELAICQCCFPSDKTPETLSEAEEEVLERQKHAKWPRDLRWNYTRLEKDSSTSA
jgi:hypothetical protein